MTEAQNVIESGVVKTIVGDMILSTAQHLFNLVFKHVPNSDHRTAALVNLEHVASLVKKALDIVDDIPVAQPAVEPTQVK